MTDHVSSPVLQPVTIGNLQLKNRIVMAPMTRSRRLASGAPLAEAPKQYWYGGDATSYSDWPAMKGG